MIEKRKNPFFTAKLNKWLESQDKSLGEIAKKLGVAQSTLSAYKNDRVPEWWVLIKISQLWGETLDQVLGLERASHPWLQALASLRPSLDRLDETQAEGLAEAINGCLKLHNLMPPQGKTTQEQNPAYEPEGRRAGSNKRKRTG